MMLNKERPEVIEAIIDYFSGEFTGECLGVKIGFHGKFYEHEFKEWANSEYVEPFKVTQAEKCILEDLYKYSGNYGLIGNFATNDGIALVVPWDIYEMPFYNHLFGWMKVGEEYKISDILENCEVID